MNLHLFSESVIGSSDSCNAERIAELEKALEDAAKERQEILEAAEKEIEYHRTIACDLEQSMVDDFEWKIHEIEADFHRKVKDMQVKVEFETDIGYFMYSPMNPDPGQSSCL